MKAFARSLTGSVVRNSTGLSLDASAAAPNSGFAFVDNAQGASLAVNELSKSVGFSLDQLESKGKIGLDYQCLTATDDWRE
jgi:hypothetical protein